MDRVFRKSGNSLSGNVQTQTFSVRTAYGSFRIETPRIAAGIMLTSGYAPRLAAGNLMLVSTGAPSTPLVKGGVQCPAREVERSAACDASLLRK